MKKILLILFVLLIPSCSQETLKTESNIEELLKQIENQNEYIEILKESNNNLLDIIEELNNNASNEPFYFHEGNVVIHYDTYVKEEDKLMVALEEYTLCLIPNEDYQYTSTVIAGTLMEVKETARVSENGASTKWYRVEAPLYNTRDEYGWIPESYLEPFDSSDTSKIINVKCIGPVKIYLDDNNELGAKSTITHSFHGVIVGEKEEYLKIALTRGNKFWISKEDIVLHFEELMN